MAVFLGPTAVYLAISGRVTVVYLAMPGRVLFVRPAAVSLAILSKYLIEMHYHFVFVFVSLALATSRLVIIGSLSGKVPSGR